MVDLGDQTQKAAYYYYLNPIKVPKKGATVSMRTQPPSRTVPLQIVWTTAVSIVGSTEQNKIGGHIGDIEFGPGVAVETKICSRTRGIVETFYTNVCRHCVGKAVGVAGHVVRTCRIKFYY